MTKDYDEPNHEKEDFKEKAGFKSSPPSKTTDEPKPKLKEEPKSNFPLPKIKKGDIEFKIQPYIVIQELHHTQPIISPKYVEETIHIKQLINVIYIKDKNGNICPYEKQNNMVNPEIMEK